MNTRQRCFLVNLNRVLIFALSLTGLLMDGFQVSDLPCSVALLVWLWLPQCALMEAKLLSRVDSRRAQPGTAKVVPWA